MEFRFVDNAGGIDAPERKLIRSHVMMGKNRGRKLKGRRKRNQPLLPQGWAVSDGGSENSDAEANQFEGFFRDLPIRGVGNSVASGSSLTISTRATTPLSPLTGGEYRYFPFPVHLTPQMRNTMYQFATSISHALYPPNLCLTPSNATSPWFAFMATNEAFLHCMLAMTTTYLSIFRGETAEPLEATKHFSQTLRLVNRDIARAGTAVPADPTIGVVISLICHANLTGRPHHSRIHLRGLRRIVALRPGGLPGLRDLDRALAQKILRADIECALLDGGPLGLVDAHGEMCAPGPGPGPAPPSIHAGLRLPDALGGLAEVLVGVTRDVMGFCRRVGVARVGGYEFHDVMIFCWQRLIAFASLAGTRPEDPLDDAWQLGLIAFLTATFYQSTQRLKVVYTGLLLEKLRERLFDGPFAAGPAHRLPYFWLLFVYSDSLKSDHNEGWVAPRVRAVGRELQVENWADAKAILHLFPWVPAVHDISGEAVWDEQGATID